MISCKGNVNPGGGGGNGAVELCGDGIAQGTEACDGTDIRSKACSDYGYEEGALSCKDDCTFDMGACSGFSSDVIVESLSPLNVNHGATLTISGSGFGVKDPAPPSLWDDFEGHDELEGLSVTAPVHGAYDRVGLSVYDRAQRYSGTSSALSHVYVGVTAYPGLVSDWIDTYGASKYGFASMKFLFLSDFVPTETQPMEVCPHHIKLLRLNSYNPDATHGYPNFNVGKIEAIESTPCPGFTGRVNDGLIEGFYAGSFSWNKTKDADWNSIQIYNHIGDLDVPNGFVGRRINGELFHVGSVETYTTSSGGSEVLTGLRSAYFAGLIKRNGYDLKIWLDDVYADFTLARVEIEGPDGIREMQIPQTWGPGEITVKFNRGKYPSGTQVMLYVYNSGNVVSNALAVLVGG